MSDGQCAGGNESRQESPQLGVDEISLSRGWYVWHVDGFGIEEDGDRAATAEQSGETVTIVFPSGGSHE